MEFLTVRFGSEEEFEKIARELIENYAIQNHDSIYRIIDIEFYWHSSTHKDLSTYTRKYVNPNQGEWFFHYSGVDIALKNEETGGYGGILIRGIYDKDKKDIYRGPMVCAMKLFSGTNAFSESINTRIIEYQESTSAKIKKGPRVGVGNNAKENGMDKLNYRFYIDPNDNRQRDK